MTDANAHVPWVAAQVKAFTGWINVKLAGGDPTLQVSNLATDLSDGVRLLHLLEFLERTSVGKINEPCKLKFHKLENMNKAFDFLKDHGFNLTGIQAPALVDETDFKGLLGLIWHLILHYQIAEPSQSEPSGTEQKESPKSRLLQWCRDRVRPYGLKDGVLVRDDSSADEIAIRNFTSSFETGVAFCGIVDSLKPGSVDLAQVLSGDAHTANLKRAFEVAEATFGVPQLLDADAATADGLDEHAVMTYLSFLRAWETEHKGKPVGDGEQSLEELRKEYEAQIAEMKQRLSVGEARVARQRSFLERVVSVDPATASSVIIAVDADRNICTWNPSAEAITGHSAEAALGQPLLTGFVPEKARSDLQTRLEAALEGPSTEPWSLSLLRKEGGCVNLLVSSQPLVDLIDDGAAARGVSLYGHDITPLQEKAIIADSAAATMVSVDSAGIVVGCSGRAPALLQTTEQQLLGSHFVDAFVSPDDRAAASELLAAAEAEGKEKGAGAVADLSAGVAGLGRGGVFHISPSGADAVEVQVTAAARFVDGAVDGAALMLQDIPSLKQQQAQLARGLNKDHDLDLFSRSRTAVVAVNNDGSIDLWNSAVASLTGVEQDQAIGSDFKQTCLHGAFDQMLFDEAMANLQESKLNIERRGDVGGEDAVWASQLDLSFKTAGGESQDVVVSVWPRLEAGELDGVWCLVSDVEGVLDRKSGPLSTCSFRLDSDLVITHCNDEARDLTGYTEEDLLGVAFEQFVREDTNHHVGVLLQEALAAGMDNEQEREVEFAMKLKSDEEVDEDVYANVIMSVSCLQTDFGAGMGALKSLECHLQNITVIQEAQKLRDEDDCAKHKAELIRQHQYELEAARNDAEAEAAIIIEELKEDLAKEKSHRNEAERKVAHLEEAGAAGSEASQQLAAQLAAAEEKNRALLAALSEMKEEIKEQARREAEWEGQLAEAERQLSEQARELEEVYESQAEKEAELSALQRVVDSDFSQRQAKTAMLAAVKSKINRSGSTGDTPEIAEWRDEDEQMVQARHGFGFNPRLSYSSLKAPPGSFESRRESVWSKLDNLIQEMQEGDIPETIPEGDEEEAPPAPESKEKSVEDLLRDFLGGIGDTLVNFKRLNQGKDGSNVYQFGTRKIHLVIINGRLFVRVGGGFMTIDEFVEKNAPAEARKLKMVLEKEGAKQRKKGDGYTSARSKTKYRVPAKKKTKKKRGRR